MDVLKSYNRTKKAQDHIKQQDLASDKQKFDYFSGQDLLNVDQDLYTPAYKRKSNMSKDTDSMLALFNARKDEVLAARATPGINQTRF